MACDGRGGEFALTVLRGQSRGRDAESLARPPSPEGTRCRSAPSPAGRTGDDAKSTASLRLLEPSGGALGGAPGAGDRRPLRPRRLGAGRRPRPATDRADPALHHPGTPRCPHRRAGGSRAGHRAEVTSLRFSPDGTQLCLRRMRPGPEAVGPEQPEGARLHPARLWRGADLRFTRRGTCCSPSTRTTACAPGGWPTAGRRRCWFLLPRRIRRSRHRPAPRSEPRWPSWSPQPGAAAASVTHRLGRPPATPELVVSSDGARRARLVAEESCISLLRSGCAIGCSRRCHLERIAVRTGRRFQTLGRWTRAARGLRAARRRSPGGPGGSRCATPTASRWPAPGEAGPHRRLRRHPRMASGCCSPRTGSGLLGSRAPCPGRRAAALRSPARSHSSGRVSVGRRWSGAAAAERPTGAIAGRLTLDCVDDAPPRPSSLPTAAPARRGHRARGGAPHPHRWPPATAHRP